MAERKVLNKYYPPDFDPSKLYKAKKERKIENGFVVRMMLPMSVKCKTCGEYLYIGTKFNMRKVPCYEEYLGIRVHRFLFKCTRCSAELAMKTDPKNSDYICEKGAERNYEPGRDMESAVAVFKKKKMMEEEGDAMKSLENRTFDSKKEMDVLDALNEVRLQNKRHACPDTDGMIKMVSNEHALDITTDDQEKLKIFKSQRFILQEEVKEEEQKKEKQKTEEAKKKENETPEIPPPAPVKPPAPTAFKNPFLKVKKKEPAQGQGQEKK